MYLYDPTNFRFKLFNFFLAALTAMVFFISLVTPDLPLRKGFIYVSGMMFCFFFVYYLSTK